MTPAEFAAIRGELGLSQLALARVLEVTLVHDGGQLALAIDNIRRHRA